VCCCGGGSASADLTNVNPTLYSYLCLLTKEKGMFYKSRMRRRFRRLPSATEACRYQFIAWVASVVVTR